jgi:hypothetical protein
LERRQVEIFYVDRKLLRHWPLPGGLDVGELLDYRTLPDGMPVLLDERMRPVEPVCGWFHTLAYERAVRELVSVSSLGLGEVGWSGVRCGAMGVVG